MASHADRVSEQRRVKLEAIDKQIKAGSLKVRKMTAEERERYPPPVPRPRRR